MGPRMLPLGAIGELRQRNHNSGTLPLVPDFMGSLFEFASAYFVRYRCHYWPVLTAPFPSL
jgi:hypothetical protein